MCSTHVENRGDRLTALTFDCVFVVEVREPSGFAALTKRIRACCFTPCTYVFRFTVNRRRSTVKESQYAYG